MTMKNIAIIGVSLFTFSSFSFASDDVLNQKDTNQIFGPTVTSPRVELVKQTELEDTKGGVTCRLFYDRANNRTYQICR